MPKDEWRNASDRSIARCAAREYAIEGQWVSYESARDDLHAADLTARVGVGRRRLVSNGAHGRRTAATLSRGGARRQGSNGNSLMIGYVSVPAALADVAQGRKYKEGNCWVLSTKRGLVIHKFSTEGDLERWWAAFQKIRGRLPRALRLGGAPVKQHVQAAGRHPGRKADAKCSYIHC